MPPVNKNLVVVITGASSGIGRRTAVALAARGASVVLAARDGETLRQAASECERAGGCAVAVPTDVADEEAVRVLARRAQQAFGRIDVWVNAAAVIGYGRFEDIPADAYRRVIETNLFGQIHGARAVLPYFRRERRGTLINLASIWGSVTSPYVSAYVVSKFGVRAFSECLRLETEGGGIDVCTILPQSVDTPIFRHAGNWTGRAIRPVPPIVAPSRVVNAIVKSIEHPRPRRRVGGLGPILEIGHAVAPRLYSRLAVPAMNAGALSRAEDSDSPGNIFAPVPGLNGPDGHWRDRRTAVAGAAIGGAAAAALAAHAFRRGRTRSGLTCAAALPPRRRA